MTLAPSIKFNCTLKQPHPGVNVSLDIACGLAYQCDGTATERREQQCKAMFNQLANQLAFLLPQRVINTVSSKASARCILHAAE
jgi:hypothetical protein